MLFYAAALPLSRHARYGSRRRQRDRLTASRSGLPRILAGSAGHRGEVSR